MQHVLRISRKIDYGLRAMIYLASVAPGSVVPFREIAHQMDVPEDFLAKILKTLVDAGLVRSTRGPHGGYALARASSEVSFLDVIEADEGPVALNVCLDGDGACGHSTCWTSLWRMRPKRPAMPAYWTAWKIPLSMFVFTLPNAETTDALPSGYCGRG